MEQIVEQGMLYDFYGCLLTEHQRRIYEMVVCQDLSLNEIAQQTGVSKQAVSDLVRRVSAQLEEYESCLGLVGKFRSISGWCRELAEVAEEMPDRPKLAGRILTLSDQIRREL